MLTQEELKERLNYNPATGQMIWRKLSPIHKRLIGKEAGCLNKKGYMVININGKQYEAHRLIWLWMTGQMPKFMIDHINQDRFDNRWENLRLATPAQNQRNRKPHKNTTSRYKGVHLEKETNKFKASIGFNKKIINLGRYKNEDDAARAYNKKALEIFGEYAYQNSIPNDIPL